MTALATCHGLAMIAVYIIENLSETHAFAGDSYKIDAKHIRQVFVHEPIIPSVMRTVHLFFCDGVRWVVQVTVVYVLLNANHRCEPNKVIAIIDLDKTN